MSVMRRAHRTNRILWAAISIAIFVLLGFWNFRDLSKTNSFWDLLAHVERGDNVFAHDDFLVALLFEFLIIAIPSVVFGWVLQAFIVVFRHVFQTNLVLWALISVAMFVPLGFVPWRGAMNTSSLWAKLSDFVNGGFISRQTSRGFSSFIF